MQIYFFVHVRFCSMLFYFTWSGSIYAILATSILVWFDLVRVYSGSGQIQSPYLGPQFGYESGHLFRVNIVRSKHKEIRLSKFSWNYCGLVKRKRNKIITKRTHKVFCGKPKP